MAVAKVRSAGGELISEPHSNTRYEDTEGNQTVYVKTPWGSLIELQTVQMDFIILQIMKRNSLRQVNNIY